MDVLCLLIEFLIALPWKENKTKQYEMMDETYCSGNEGKNELGFFTRLCLRSGAAL